MNRVLKFKLPAVGGNEAAIRLPVGSKPLFIGKQMRDGRDVPMLWAICDDDAEKWEAFEWWTLRAVHTGVALGERCTAENYLGTAILGLAGTHVIHYFRVA
jgi:hypothetical protein